MKLSRALIVAQVILFTIPWSAPAIMLYVIPTFRESFTTVALVWAAISPFILAGTSVVAYQFGLNKATLLKPVER